MLIIGEAVIDDTIGQASFCCNLDKCKGACCFLEGGRGAPLRNNEIYEVEKAYPIVKAFLCERSIQTIESSGLYDGKPDDYATTCIDRKDCVFVYFEGDIAKCSFEKAFIAGLTTWRKPISCHLFPIRVRRIGQDLLRYEQIDECQAGRELGEDKNIKLRDFLEQPLARHFGDPWFKEFSEECKTKFG